MTKYFPLIKLTNYYFLSFILYYFNKQIFSNSYVFHNFYIGWIIKYKDLSELIAQKILSKCDLKVLVLLIL